jgi:hypothetical protein
MDYIHRRLRKARRHVQQNVMQIRILNDVLGEVMCLDSKEKKNLKFLEQARARGQAKRAQEMQEA